jgi:hypothetical protein
MIIKTKITLFIIIFLIFTPITTSKFIEPSRLQYEQKMNPPDWANGYINGTVGSFWLILHSHPTLGKIEGYYSNLTYGRYELNWIDHNFTEEPISIKGYILNGYTFSLIANIWPARGFVKISGENIFLRMKLTASWGFGLYVVGQYKKILR